MIEVSLERVLFQDDESGFVIADMSVINGVEEIPKFVKLKANRSITCKGYFPQHKSLNLSVCGRWELSKYGYQLIVDSYNEVIPKTEKGLIAYLSSGLIYGIGEKTAERIVAQFGLNTLSVFDNTPELLLKLKGISRKKLDRIIESYNNHRAVAQIINYLAPLGVTPAKCMAIYKEFEDDSMNILTNEPFKLCSIRGFGFVTVDAIARKTSFNLSDELRIKAAIKYILEQAAASEGHICLNQGVLTIKSYLLLNCCEKLYNKCCKFLQSNSTDNLKEFLTSYGVEEVVNYTEIIRVINLMALTGELKGDNSYAYLENNYYEETYIAKNIATRLKLNVSSDISSESIRKEIKRLEAENKIVLSTKQKEAIETCVKNNICVITGGPGTGKSTVLKFVLAVCKRLLKVSDEDITLLAPTGRAAARMAEATNNEYSASTIHSRLHIVEEEGSTYSSDAIDSDIVVVDEASMVDSYVMFSLVRALPYSSKFIIIGDAEQLPSVGAGNILFELLKSKIVPTVRLDTIYRQSGTSLIVVNSDLIKHNVSTLRYGDTFKFIPISSYDKSETDRSEKIQNETAQIVIEQVIEELKATSIDNVQVLCPFRKKGVKSGATELNKLLQEKINPKASSKKEVTKGNYTYRVGDKVMQIKNDYNLSWKKGLEEGYGVFNGECGYITNINDDNEVTINYDGKIVVYDVTLLDEIELAYAISIHKSQGSEYKTVVIPMLSAYSIMLRRNLIYTAITRAKNKVIIVGEQRAVDIAVHNNSITRRNTQLADKIIQEVEKAKNEKPVLKDKQLNLFEK